MINFIQKTSLLIALLITHQLFAGTCNENQLCEPGAECFDYVGDGNEHQYLEILNPYTNGPPRPAIVFIHGGGWKNKGIHCFGAGDAMLDRLVNDFVVVNINYRYSTDAIFPAQIHDCKTAIRYLRSIAEDYNIDPCNIGVIGESAGGHLSALLGASNGAEQLEGYHLGSAAYSSDVQAVVTISPVIDMTVANQQLENLNFDCNNYCGCSPASDYNDMHSFGSQLIGCTVEFCPEKAAAMSPLTYIDGNEPSFFIYHGEKDCIVPAAQSQLLYDDLVEANPNSTMPNEFGYINYKPFENGCHFGIIKDGNTITEVSEYFNEKLAFNNCADICNNFNNIQIGNVLRYNDADLFIDDIGFSNNTSINFIENESSPSSNLSNINLEVFFRVESGSCENEIEILVTDPNGSATLIQNIFTTCNGPGRLYYKSISLNDVSTSSNNNNWVIQFNDANGNNTSTEYSVRFARLTYDYESINDCDGDGITNGNDAAQLDPCIGSMPTIPATNLGDCDGDGVTNADEINGLDGNPATIADNTNPSNPCDLNHSQITLPVVNTDPCSACEYDDDNIFTVTKAQPDEVDVFSSSFNSNAYLTIKDPGTPSHAKLSDITFQIYFRVFGGTCENDFQVQITDPSGIVYETGRFLFPDEPCDVTVNCDGVAGSNHPNNITGLYVTEFTIPYAFTTGNMDNWILRFNDEEENNSGSREFRVGHINLNYKYTLINADGNDCDGDGVTNANELNDNTDPFDPCDFNSTSITLPVTSSCSGSNKISSPSLFQDINQTQFTLYPNPAKQYFNVHSTTNNINRIDVFDAIGTLVISSTGEQTDVGHLPMGLYLVKIYFKEGTTYKKLTISE